MVQRSEDVPPSELQDFNTKYLENNEREKIFQPNMGLAQ